LREQEVNAVLSASAKKREEDLERSRRTLDRERELLYQEELDQKKDILRSAAAAREFELSRRRIEEESRRRYEEDVVRKIE
jgi:hypothetical protein